MKPKARGLDEFGSKPAPDPETSQCIEQSLTLAEDARAEAAATARERDALAEALRRAEAEALRRDAEMEALRARLANAEAAFEMKEAEGLATAEELRVAMAGVQAAAVDLAEANDAQLHLHSDRDRRLSGRTAGVAERATQLRAAPDAVPHRVWTV